MSIAVAKTTLLANKVLKEDNGTEDGENNIKLVQT